MSTSDAGESELRVVAERATPRSRTALSGRSAAARAQEETRGDRFLQENHGYENITDQDHQLPAVSQEGAHRALIFGADVVRLEKAAHCAGSEIQIQKPSGPRLASSLFLTLSQHRRFDKQDQKLRLTPDPHPQSLTEPQKAETEDSCGQFIRRTSPPETDSDCLLPEATPSPASKEEEVITVVCNELETNKDLSGHQHLSHSDCGPHEHNGLHILPCEAQPKRTGSGSIELEDDIKFCTKFEDQKDLEELSNPAVTMLSSTVVTVLAPHWSGRLRRTKRFEGNGNSEDVTKTVSNHRYEPFQEIQNQHGVEKGLADGSQAQIRVPLVGTRRNTVDWSVQSGPARLEYESKRKIIQTVSLDANSGRMDNRKLDAGPISPVITTASPLSPLCPDPNERRRNPQTGHQGALSALSSKPTTSSLLLSLRRVHSSGRSSNAAPTLSEENPSPSDQEGNLFRTHISQTFLNNNEQERPKSSLSPSISYRSTETGPVLSSNHRERNVSESHFFSTSPINKDTGETPFTQQPQAGSKLTFLSRGPSARQQNCRGSEKNTDLPQKSLVSTPRPSPYDPSALLKTHSLPRGTTLTSTSWWKQVTPECSSPLTLNDPTNIKDEVNTPCNDNRDLASPGATDNKRFSSQIPNNRDNNNTTESVYKGNMNVVMKTQGGTPSLKQRHAENSPDYKSDRLVKQQYGSNLNIQKPQKLHHLPGVLSLSKISSTTAQTTLSHSKDLSKRDVRNSLFTANVTESPPTSLNPKSLNTPTESSRKHSNNHCSSRTNSIFASPQNKEKFTKQSFSLATTITLNSQALTSKATSGLSPVPNTNTSSSSHPVSFQTSTHTSSPTGSSSQTPKITTTGNATPLGFERSYGSMPKPFRPKTVSSLTPTVSAFSKTNYSPLSIASIAPSTTTDPSPSLLTPPATPIITSSPTTITLSSLLTPPTTPNITSPIYSKTSNPKEGRTFSSSPERDPKNPCPREEGKRVRRVTWEDSVDLQRSEPVTVEKPHPSGAPTSPLSPSRSPRSIRAPSIFSFLRSNSPTTNTSPLSPTPSSIQIGKGGKYRSLSSDSADLTSRERERSKQRPCDTTISDQGRWDLTTPRQERTLSVESGTVQCRSSAPLSLPSDFSSAYKLRYSSTPYSTLMSSRSTQGESNTFTIRSPLFQKASQPIYSPHLSIHTEPVATMTIPTSKPHQSPISPPQTLSLPFQNKAATQESAKCGVSETSHVNNNHSKNNSQDHLNGQILLVDNRFHISSQCLQGDKAHSSSTCVTETMVYSIKSKVDTATAASKNTTPKPLQHNANTVVSLETRLSQQPHTVQNKEVSGEPSDQSSSGGSSAESQSQDEEGCNRRTKESVLGKGRFFSVESSSEQSPKRSRFALKRSVSTPNSTLSRSDSERANKTNNKMDQVLNRLRQTFSTRRTDDDLSFPWKWKRSSQTPSVSGSSDISISDINADSTKMLEEREQEGGVVLKDNEKVTEGTKTWTQNRYTIIPSSAVGSTGAGEQFSIWSDKSAPETDQDEQETTGLKFESKSQVHLKIHSPTTHQFDFYNDNRTDYRPTNQFPSCRDHSPGRSPNPSVGYPSQFRKSTSNPRSPFSPFSSLSPLYPFPSPDVTDDSVFYSPKLQRRSISPCEPGEGIRLGGSRKSRVSTGPPSAGQGHDKEHLTSSYADLKYGIEPGRSFSVSSVLSSRPSGPGRISTGPRFMSVGDLSESSLTCRGTSKDWDQWAFTPDWSTSEYGCQPPSDCHVPYFPSDPGKMRSRSLPRSLTRRLANWSSGVSVAQPVTTASSKQAHLWSPNMTTCHFGWDTEGPPTPPPTPPLSPVSRRVSTPTSLSSPFPSSPGAPQSADSQSPRGHLPSRGYISSLSTFEESSDSSSDTTTDDEYYLETGEGEEKETEL